MSEGQDKWGWAWEAAVPRQASAWFWNCPCFRAAYKGMAFRTCTKMINHSFFWLTLWALEVDQCPAAICKWHLDMRSCVHFLKVARLLEQEFPCCQIPWLLHSIYEADLGDGYRHIHHEMIAIAKFWSGTGSFAELMKYSKFFCASLAP